MLAGTTAAIFAIACSGTDPQVGPEREVCHAYADACAFTGDPCDDCESLSCCPTRLGCYNEATCSCADSQLDDCLGVDAAAGGDPTAVAQCWATFAASGTAAKARIACQRAYCAEECGVPAASAIAQSDAQ
jgi:hypothetical protein